MQSPYLVLAGIGVAALLLAAAGSSEQLRGHYRYTIAPINVLTTFAEDPSIQLRPAAAQALRRMQRAARLAGIELYPISGFRDRQVQEFYFFTLKAKHRQSTAQRLHVCAPPGFSEHHTGYAVDIGDAHRRRDGAPEDFTDTAAYRWLLTNAARFHFEMSFPADNRQGLAFEPWHWRYVGDMASFYTFFGKRDAVTFASLLPSF